jgi:ABC-type polysaccharide/polyol phosphate export permease
LQIKKESIKSIELRQSHEEDAHASESYTVRVNSFRYHFDLILHLVKRDIALRYKRSVLGVAWSLVQPMAQLMVLVFLFQKVVPLNIDAYPAFVFSGLLAWTWFSSCLGSAGGLFINNRDLMRQPNFEPFILIIVNTLSNMLIYLVALPILFVVLNLYDKAITIFILLVPLIAIIQSVLTVGLGLLISTLNVFYRDVEQIVNLFLMLLFYLTPVFYKSQMVGESYRIFYTINPVAVLIQAYRSVFFYGTAPDWNSLLLASSISIAVCVAGYYVYRRRLNDVIDLI